MRAAFTFLGTASASQFLAGQTWTVESEFAKYLAQFNKNYLTSEEYNMRLQAFAQNHYEIMKHNERNESLKLGHNHMSDWTDAEYKELLGYLPRENTAETYLDLSSEAIPAEKDWRTSLESMRVIKDQGHCGSCWAFSTIGSVEAATEINGFGYTSLSEQQLVDCVPYALGCNGGNYMTGFEYLEGAGAEKETDYPYKAVDEWKCSADPKKFVNKHLKSWDFVTPYSPDAMRAAIARQPVSVSIEADQKVFQLYKEGVIAVKDCGTVLDHAVLAIGYGTENGMDYVLIRNSWSSTWGDHGCVKLQLTKDDGACGVLADPAFAITDKK